MKFTAPENCEPLKAADANQDVLKFLSQRRSALVRAMAAPGPDPDTLDLILRLAARAPDHRKLTPWRFLVFKDQARADFGDHLARLFQTDCADMPAERIVDTALKFHEFLKLANCNHSSHQGIEHKDQE